MEKQRMKQMFSNINIKIDGFGKHEHTSTSSIQLKEPLLVNNEKKDKKKNAQKKARRRLDFEEGLDAFPFSTPALMKTANPLQVDSIKFSITEHQPPPPTMTINENLLTAPTIAPTANKVDQDLAESIVAPPSNRTPPVSQIITNFSQVSTIISPLTHTPNNTKMMTHSFSPASSSSPNNTLSANKINLCILQASSANSPLRNKLPVSQVDLGEPQASGPISLMQASSNKVNECILQSSYAKLSINNVDLRKPHISASTSPLKETLSSIQTEENVATTSTVDINKTSKSQKKFICKIDMTRLSANMNNLKANYEESDKKNINKPLPSGSTSNLNKDNSDSSSSLDLSSQASRKICRNTLNANRKTYEISPMNSGESDVDLSDTDPTYDLNRRSCDRNLPSRLLRKSRSPSSSSSDSSENSDSDSTVIEEKQERKSRKRIRDPENWRDNCAKRQRNSGQSYVSVRTKKLVPARTVQPPCTQKCRLKCYEHIGEADRKTMFAKFWGLKNIALQRNFIKTCMIEVKPKYKYSQTESARNNNTAFYLKIDDKKQRVCKTFFINTFDITDRMLRTIKEKCDENDFMDEDLRGKHGNHKKLSDSLVNDIKNFIDSIPRVESHYTRATSSCEYIHPGRTLTEIYQDFVEKQRTNERPWGKFCNFYEIFKSTGIKIHQPKKDLCDLCTTHKLSPSDLKLKEDYDRHIEEKEISREEKRKDRNAIDENNICAIYDLQAILQTPRGNSSSFYYKSKLNCYNFTIAELAKRSTTEEESHKAYTDVYSYFWDETQGQKGSTEIGTCLYHFLNLINDRDTSKSVNVIFYSDNCCGQNKNKYIVTLYMFALQQFKNINSITHKFLIKGHTQNENDNAHSLIEKNVQKYLKADPIYTPSQYITLIKSAKKTGKKFQVQALTFEDFSDIKKLQSEWGPNFNKSVDRNQVSWNDIKILECRKGEPFQFYYKTSYKDTSFQEVNVRAGIRKALPTAENISFEKAYGQRFELESNKKRDLTSLISSKVIPAYFANYYNDIIGTA